MNPSRIAAAVAAVLALSLAPTYAAASPQPSAPSADAVVNSLVARMEAVAGYKAHIRVDLQMHSFPWLATTLDGSTTYQRPGRYTVTFNSVPSLASAFQKVSGDIGDPAAWRDKYDVALDSSTPAHSGEAVLRLTEKVRGQIDHALAFVDLSSATVSRMQWYYYSGGRISMEQHFTPIDGVLLVDHQTADIDMPGYQATAQAVFDGYNVQVTMNLVPTAAR